MPTERLLSAEDRAALIAECLAATAAVSDALAVVVQAGLAEDARGAAHLRAVLALRAARYLAGKLRALR